MHKRSTWRKFRFISASTTIRLDLNENIIMLLCTACIGATHIYKSSHVYSKIYILYICKATDTTTTIATRIRGSLGEQHQTETH